MMQPALKHVDQLVSIAVETMFDNPLYETIFPDESTRADDLATLHRDALNHLLLLNTGIVWATDSLDAFAVIYRLPLPFRTEPGGPVFIDQGARRRWEKLSLEHRRRYRAPAGLLLQSVCVATTSQRVGHGTALLAQAHSLADFHGVPITTGTAEPTALPWLMRSGYGVKADLADLEHGPRYWFLERPAQ